jgi:hypothetical protein
MDPVWDELTRPETLGEESVRVRQGLAHAVKNYNKHQELVNTTRPGGSSLYAPLHQAVHGGAPPEIVHRLIGRGAWRSYRMSGANGPSI